MFEGIKARMLTAAANKTGLLLLPSDPRAREIAEAMFLEGVSVEEINKHSLGLYIQALKGPKPEFVSKYEPVAETTEGPLNPIRPKT